MRYSCNNSVSIGGERESSSLSNDQFYSAHSSHLDSYNSSAVRDQNFGNTFITIQSCVPFFILDR